MTRRISSRTGTNLTYLFFTQHGFIEPSNTESLTGRTVSIAGAFYNTLDLLRSKNSVEDENSKTMSDRELIQDDDTIDYVYIELKRMGTIINHIWSIMMKYMKEKTDGI